ncbi:MAG: hypothetical protein OXG92_00475 [Chloroflexi bacterium]|nr:hypothetical protein [Chloroflexota bacterium]MCY3581965.1 hypothetical protein [Chloroflexota bacterium]MCY3714930.1 hypothetical protein [Chloroflexota bacterium]MDE2652134.1 hypothetical protein [Chloroflexota bacterium]MXX51905.1 hypothetical protein [Chloroflexota bacterium]
MREITKIVKFAGGLWLARALFAYLDPGSGSLIVQLLLAIIVGLLATLRLWKARLLALFGIRSGQEEADDDDPAEPRLNEQA